MFRRVVEFRKVVEPAVAFRKAVEPASVVLEIPGFVEAAAVVEHPGPPAGMAAETRPVVAAVAALEGGRRDSVASPPPIANPERDSTQVGTGVRHPFPLGAVAVVAG